MDLRYTKEQEAFRKEIRKWFKDNVPKEKLLSFDSSIFHIKKIMHHNKDATHKDEFLN